MFENLSMSTAILFIILGVVFTVTSQLLLKLAAQEQQTGLRQFLNKKVFIAYSLFFLTTVVNVLALKVIPLSYAPIWNAAAFIILNAICYFFLHEKMSKRKIIGLMCILAGVLVFMIP